MKILVDRNSILPALNEIGGIVEKRQTLPILSNVLVKYQNNLMYLTATDLEIEITTSIKIRSNEEGEFTIPARKFIDICRALPEGSELSIDISEGKAKIKSGRSKFLLGILSAADFPSIEITGDEDFFEIGEHALKDLIDRTSFSMAHQDVRYYLNGMLIELKSKKIRAVCTDGHRLAVCEKELIEDGPKSRNFLLPRKAVQEIGRIIGSSDEKMKVYLSKNLVRFRVRETIFTSKLIDGKFPDYERVIPKNCDKTAVIVKETFKNALIRASILSSDKYKGIRITIEDSLLKLQAHNPEQEEAEEELEVDYDSQQITIGFNVGYLLDILNVLKGDNVSIDFADQNSSSIVRTPGNGEALYVVMPMRL